MRRIASSFYPKKINARTSSISSYNNCDICQNYMIFDNAFISTVTGKSYFIRGQLNCESISVIYFITCSKCLDQYLGSAVKLELDSSFINPTSKLKRKDKEVPEILIVCVIMTLIIFNTLRFYSSNKYRVIVWRKLKTFYGTGKSTASPSYLP